MYYNMLDKEEIISKLLARDSELLARNSELLALNSELLELNIKLNREKFITQWVHDCISLSELMEAIGELKFHNIRPDMRQGSGTDPFIKQDSNSITTAENTIKMSKFNIRMLAKKLPLVKYNILSDQMKPIVIKKFNIKASFDFDLFIEKFEKILFEIQNMLSFYTNHRAFNEITTQKIFVLFYDGIFNELNKHLEDKKRVFSINGLVLETDVVVNTKKNDQMNQVTKKAIGQADVAIGSLIQTNRLRLEDLLNKDFVIGKIKKSDGDLSNFDYDIGRCTSQQIIKTMALADMREKKGIPFKIVKSFLTDLNKFRILIRIVNISDDSKEISHFISSLFEDRKRIILSLLFIVCDINYDDLDIENSNTSVVDYADLSDYEENDENEDEDEFKKFEPLYTSSGPKGEKVSYSKTGKENMDSNILYMGEPPINNKDAFAEKLRQLYMWESERLNFPVLSFKNMSKN